MDKESLRVLLAQGLSLAQIGDRYGKDPSTIGYWVRKHGLEAVGKDKYAPRGGIDRAVLEAFVAEGLSMSAMSRRLGVSLATVRHWMSKYGLRSTAYVRRSHPGVTKPRHLERTCRKHGRVQFVLVQGGYRCPRCNSDRVSERRRKVKRILVEEAGGGCVACGYRRSAVALQFHHLDPTTKRFELSRRGVTRSLDEAREEAKKCVLLCANCHAEVEAGLLALDAAA